MAAVSIRDLDDTIRDKIRQRAARNGRSMEAEMRAILSAAVSDDEQPGLFDVLTKRFAQLGGADLDLSRRFVAPRAADFDE